MRARDDWTHTREIGQCSYPYDTPFIPKCEACVRRVPRLGEGHTFVRGECRFAASTDIRRPHKRQKHRDAQPKHSSEPTQHAPATVEGKELGAEAEAHAAAAPRPAPQTAAGSAIRSHFGSRSVILLVLIVLLDRLGLAVRPVPGTVTATSVLPLL